ncbi:DUF7935 family protein [Botryobacter ruber]|uniref:DUF7935 family protein n=1 Tax=Botryobacter ruber TaxID=2171629 RepID=UPI000E0CA2C0|nr:hypothetical protein [Botryobacter ruber]
MENGLMFLMELLRLALPALIVAGAMYYVVNRYLDRDYKSRVLDLRMKNSEIILPIRLQAYERIILLLERITPSNLLIRVSGAGLTAAEYHRVLVTEIREEFNHNLSQQVYMTEQAWQMVKRAQEGVINMVNTAYQNMPQDAKGTDLAKRVLEMVLAGEAEPTADAISFLKQEIAQVF